MNYNDVIKIIKENKNLSKLYNQYNPVGSTFNNMIYYLDKLTYEHNKIYLDEAVICLIASLSGTIDEMVKAETEKDLDYQNYFIKKDGKIYLEKHHTIGSEEISESTYNSIMNNK